MVARATLHWTPLIALGGSTAVAHLVLLVYSVSTVLTNAHPNRAAMAEHVWMKSTRLLTSAHQVSADPNALSTTSLATPTAGAVQFHFLVRSLVLVHDNFSLCRCPSLHSDRHAVEQVVAMDTRVNQLSAYAEYLKWMLGLQCHIFKAP